MTSSGPLEAPLAWNVAGLLTDESGAERILDVADARIDLGDDLRLAEPIAGRVRLVRTNRGILATADLRTALDLECSRCLRQVILPVDIRFQEEYLPSLDLATGRPLATDDEPDVGRLTDHHELDLETLGPRRDPAGRADRTALPSGLPRSVHRLRATGSTKASTTIPTTTSTRGSRRSAAFARTRADPQGSGCAPGSRTVTFPWSTTTGSSSAISSRVVGSRPSAVPRANSAALLSSYHSSIAN